MDDDTKILQIIPAPGWRARYSDMVDLAWTEDLVCWALIEQGGRTQIVGMIASASAIIPAADRSSDFIGYGDFGD